ncbi:MAG: hypothetical protein ACJ74Q_15820 [Pyrinomonadaceae bacterium]
MTVRRTIRVLLMAWAAAAILASSQFSARAQSNSNTNPGDPFLVCELCWQDESPSPTPATRPRRAPTPIPTPEPWGSSQDKGLSGQFIRLADHARELVPTIRRLVEKPLLGLLQRISWVLASLILVASFIRVMRENNGASDDFYYWIARGALWMNLLIVGPFVVSAMLIVGNALTIPLDNVTTEMQTSFDDKYQEFMEGHFIIRDDKAVFLAPMADGKPGLLGILWDKEAKITDIDKIDKALDVSSWSMPKLFTLLAFCRGSLEFFDFFLIVAGGIILIGLRLGSPVAIAMGIDQKLAHQMTYPYAWGTAAFTLVFPLFRDILRIVAYIIGNVGLAMYDGRPMYWMDERTGQIITRAGYEPSVTIFIAAFMMLVAALSMPMSTVLAYRFLKGQNFEGISSVTGGWMASIVGTGIETFGFRAAATIQKQAENTQIQGGYQSEMTRAGGSLEAGNLGARARQIAATANVQGGLAAALANIRGNQVTQTMIATAAATFGKETTAAGVRLSQQDIAVNRDKGVGSNNAGLGRDTINYAGEAYSDKYRIMAHSVGNVGGQVGNAIEGVGLIGGIPLAITAGGLENKAVGYKNRAQNLAANTYTGNMNNLETSSATRLGAAQDAYGSEMGAAYDKQSGSQIAAAGAGASIAAGGAQHGANISLGGINQSYKLETKANQTVFDSTVKAAGISRDAAVEAANLRALGTVVSSVFRDVARRIDDGLKPRY